MKTIAALLAIVMAALPSLFAGWPGLAPAWFDRQWQGVPLSVVFMSGLMLAFVVLAGICSAISKDRSERGAD